MARDIGASRAGYTESHCVAHANSTSKAESQERSDKITERISSERTATHSVRTQGNASQAASTQATIHTGHAPTSDHPHATIQNRQSTSDGPIRHSGPTPPKRRRGVWNFPCSRAYHANVLHELVELRGVEPLTFSMPWRCATGCAKAPCGVPPVHNVGGTAAPRRAAS